MVIASLTITVMAKTSVSYELFTLLWNNTVQLRILIIMMSVELPVVSVGAQHCCAPTSIMSVSSIVGCVIVEIRNAPLSRIWCVTKSANTPYVSFLKLLIFLLPLRSSRSRRVGHKGHKEEVYFSSTLTGLP